MVKKGEKRSEETKRKIFETKKKNKELSDEELKKQREERKVKRREQSKESMRKLRMKPEHLESKALYYKDVVSKKNLDLKLEVFNHYAKEVTKTDTVICACCGYSDFRFLSLDHIESRKNVPIEEKKLGGINLWRYLKEKGLPLGYQVLCHNCNIAKGDRKYCPHQLDKMKN